MHAASNKQQNSSLRNQLLSNDIGNIDIRYESQINQPPQPPMQQQQYHPNQRPGPPPPQQFHQPYVSSQNQQGYGTQPGLYSQPPAGHYGQPQPHVGAPPSAGSRRSSITSDHSNLSMFRRKKNKSMKTAYSNDEDDDGKEIVIDPASTNGMSFDDLTTIRDRGRYGSGSTFDTTPIIPTLDSSSFTAGSAASFTSNSQYRKRMTTFKKRAMAQAGRPDNGDPRAMSLQTGVNPYLNSGDPLQGSFPNRGPPFANDPRSNSFNSQPPPSGNQGPRAYSLTNQPPHFNQGPRENALTNQPPFPQQQQQQQQQRGPPPSGRAYSLNVYGNSYQQAPPSGQGQRPIGRGPPPPGNRGPNYRGGAPPANVHRNSLPGVPSPLGQSQSSIVAPVEPFQQQKPTGSVPQNQLSNIQVPYIQPVHPQQRIQTQRDELPAPYSVQNETIQETTNNSTDSPKTHRSFSEKESSHHYLADNHQDDSLGFTSTSEASVSKERMTLPKEESTPSPIRQTLSHQIENPHVSPSKLPRSKGLPHLSLLSLRDDSDSSDEDINKDISSRSSPDRQPASSSTSTPAPYKESAPFNSANFVPSVLEPLDESKPYEVTQRATTPPNHVSNSRNSTVIATPGSRTSKMISPVKRDPYHPGNRHSNQVSISSMSQNSAVSADPENFNNEHNKKLYGLASVGDTSANHDKFVTASQFSILGSKADVAGDYDDFDDISRKDPGLFNDQSTIGQSTLDEQKGRSLNEHTSRYSFNDEDKTPKLNYVDSTSTNDESRSEFNEDFNRTPLVAQQNSFSKSVNTTPLNIKRNSVESGSSAKSGSKKGGFRSPGFLKKWARNRGEKKKHDEFEQVSKPIDNSKIASSGTFESRNVSNYSEKELDRSATRFTDPGQVESSEVSDANGTVPHRSINLGSSTEDQSSNKSSQARDLPKIKSSSSHIAEPMNKATTLGESFVPTAKKIESESGHLNFTVEQLGIMEAKSDLIQELELVSKELAASIRREIQLEEKLNKPEGNPSSPYLTERAYENQLRESALQIAELTRKLNEERKIRYIAEEHVFLHENNQEPSALKLNYEMDQLKSEMISKDETISKIESELHELKEQLPSLKQKLDESRKENEEHHSTTIPNLRNQIEILENDKKKLSILYQKYKILKTEKLELEQRLNDSNSSDIFINQPTESRSSMGNTSSLNSETKSSNRPSPSHQKPFLSGNNSFEDKPESPSKSKRLTSFSLLNMPTAQK